VNTAFRKNECNIYKEKWCSKIQGDTKKQELLKNPTKIEEIQEKKIIDRNYNLPFKRQ